MQEIVALCRALNVSDKILLTGGRSYQDLPIYYGLANAFVHASTTEQWGLVVNEAMAAGLPVLISNRCGCAPELVHEGKNGYTFDPYDVEGLSVLLGRIAGGRERLAAFGQASEAIIAEWGPQRFSNALFDAASVALNSPPRPMRLSDRLLLSC